MNPKIRAGPLRRAALAAALLVTAASCTTGAEGAGTGAVRRADPPAVEASTLARLACSLPHDWIVKTWRGWRADRGPDIQMLPHVPDFVAQPGVYPHAGPWPYLERVPMLWYGPGFVPAQGRVDTHVNSADVAPTIAQLLKFSGFHAPDGHPMPGALLPSSKRPLPRLVVVVVYDAGGKIILDTWMRQHPHLDALIPKGTYFSHADVGSAPTSTAQIHATLGTGSYPRHHGITANHLRVDGTIRGPWRAGPRYLMEPTLADVYDKAKGNQPLVALVGSTPWHLAIMSHGSYSKGGDKDLAVLHPIPGSMPWNVPPADKPFYSFPSYVDVAPPLSAYFHTLDAADGTVDDKWLGHVIPQTMGGWDTPARIPWETRAVEDVVTTAGMGKDATPDLLFVNYKLIDEVGHIWNLNSREMRDTVHYQDADLPKLISFLNGRVGRGKWAMLLTADHGHTPDPRVSGAVRLSPGIIRADVEKQFDDDSDAVSLTGPNSVQPSSMFIDKAELADNGYTLGDIARFLMTLTVRDVATPGSHIPHGHGDDRAFRAVFPSRILPQLPCLPGVKAG